MLTVNDLMTVAPQWVTPDTPLVEIERLMCDEGCRHLPVLEKGQLVGIITDRDLRAVIKTPLMAQGSAESIMTPRPVTVTPSTPAYRAAEMLNLYKFNALPVIDRDELVGIVTSTDFLAYFASEARRETRRRLRAGEF